MDPSTDSTHYSFHKNLKCTEIENYQKLRESEFLDELHNKILLHWEGEKLITKIEALKYVDQISTMTFDTYKDKYFAEKVQSSLLKIVKLETKFEKILSQKQLGHLSDPIESLTEDLYVACGDNKKVLFLNNDEERSFQVDLLTNDNFISMTPALNRSALNSKMCLDAKSSTHMPNKSNMHININSEELFTSQNSIVQMKHWLHNIPQRFSNTSNVEGNNLSSDEVIPLKRQCISDISKETITDEHCLSQSSRKGKQCNDINDQIMDDGCDFQNNTYQQSQIYSNNIEHKNIVNDDVKNKKTDVIDTQTINQGSQDISNTILESDHCRTAHNKCNIIQEIPNTDENIQEVFSKNFANTAFSKILFYKEEQGLKSLPDTLRDSKHLIKFGKMFNEVYNRKINKICYDTDKAQEGEYWQKIQEDLKNKVNIATTVNDTLTRLFEKISLEEHESIERLFKETCVYKKGDFHKFSLEDEAKLDVENMFAQNKIRLEEISAEFKDKIRFSKTGSANHEGLFSDNDEMFEYEGLDWRKLLDTASECMQ